VIVNSLEGTDREGVEDHSVTLTTPELRIRIHHWTKPFSTL
jgi:hypothetical protein